MIPPELPRNERERQKAVEKYKLLDTLPEESYDNITTLMAYICDTPISLITLLDKDRNFLKSHFGVPFNESPREISFCGHAINSEDEITVIEDARIDERFHDNPLVSEHNAIFYAGVPLVNPDGFKLGTLCVYDTKPRVLSEAQVVALKAMSNQVIRLMEEHYKNIQLEILRSQLEQRNQNLEKFAGVVSHDLKSPLAQIRSLMELLEQDLDDDLNEETRKYMEYIKDSSDSLRGYIDGILRFYRTDQDLEKKKDWIDTEELVTEIEGMFKGDRNASIHTRISEPRLHINKAAITQVLVNLISNAIKYNDKEKQIVNILVSSTDDAYHFSVSDNGPGIPEESASEIFELFSKLHDLDRYGKEGTGIGLATVKKVIESLGGEISLRSELGIGSTFEFHIPK